MQVNIESLQCIASSLLVVCLDEQMQNVSDQTRSRIKISLILILPKKHKIELLQFSNTDKIICRSMKEMFKQMLTGAGSRFNGGNRWFDKTVQVRREVFL